MTAAAMEAAMTDLMLGKTAFGATPMGGSVKKIEELITKDMQPKVLEAHRSDQKNLNRLANDIKKCGSVKADSLKKAQPSLKAYNKDSKDHTSCRTAEAVKHQSKTKCLVEQRALYKEKTLKCNYFATLSRNFGNQKNNRAIVTKAGSEKVEQYLIRISGTICGDHTHGTKGEHSKKGGWGGGLKNSMLDKYLRAKDACERAKKVYNAKVRECNRKIAAYKTQKQKCNQYQKLMDTNSCKHAVMVKDTCEAYAGCYYSKRKAYRLFEQRVIAEETDRKAEWRGLRRMECLIKAFADGKVTGAEVDTCKKKTVDTKLLNIKYPKIPPLQKCLAPMLYPATGEYKKKEFKPLPTVAKGMESQRCAGMDTIPTTPRKGSPATAKCVRVSLQGHYSAGPLVKCTNGIDVHKSLDMNSCPTGTKIFSPRTRDDWKTFLASAGPLRAPHWIIDVTRPQNGCGGCTRYSMKSTTPQRPTWRTSDRSPWWLRNSRYNEPNGDYTANCFLDLWRKPPSENAVTFNDGRCNYRSRSYYCQPIKTKPKPPPAVKKSAVLGFKTGLKWVLSAKGVPCLDTCLKIGASCEEGKYPKTLKAFKDILNNKMGFKPGCNWQCYLDRYPDLQKAFGKTNVKRAEKHWKDHGKKEKRECRCSSAKCRRVYTGGWKFNPTMEPDTDCFWRGHGSNRCRGDKKAGMQRPSGFSVLARSQPHGFMPKTERRAQAHARAGVRSALKTSGRRKRLIWQRSWRRLVSNATQCTWGAGKETQLLARVLVAGGRDMEAAAVESSLAGLGNTAGFAHANKRASHSDYDT